MTAAPNPSALAAEDEARLAALVAEVLADAKPDQKLRDAIAALEALQKPGLAAALYEGLCYRVPSHDYWLHYRMWKAYDALGPARCDAAFLHAAAAVQMHPDWSGSEPLAAWLFAALTARGADRAALALFRAQMQHAPDKPSAPPAAFDALLARLGPDAPPRLASPQPPQDDAWHLHPVQPAEPRPPWTPRTIGAAAPYALATLARPLVRPAIDVAEFADAELLLCRDTVTVTDGLGRTHDMFSVGEFPGPIRAYVERRAVEDGNVEQYEAAEAVVIADRFPAPNICHFLYDQSSRLALYRQIGVDIGQALVVGPEPHMPAQQEILRRAGVRQYLGTARFARVRVRRLFVSSNCRELQHPAHLGAGWAVAFMRQVLGGRGSKGWRRLYISRGDVPARQVTNEAEVIALLEPYGFEAIQPGRMSYDAQLAAFKQASHVVAPHGAALTHIVLCPPGAQVLEIFHPLYGTASFASQVPAAGLRYTAALGRDWASDAPEWNDPTRVDVTTNRFLDRHMRIDLPALAAWLKEAA